MGASVQLTRSATKALEREIKDQLLNASRECKFRSDLEDLGDYRDEQEANVLACAEMISALYWAEVGWAEDEPRREIEFSARALAYIEKMRDETRDHIAYLDESDEGSEKYQAREAFLLHVLERICGVPAEAVAV